MNPCIYLALACTLLFATALEAAPSVTEHFHYYQVKADSNDTLLTAINKASPVRYKGEVRHGYTDTHVKWNYRWKAGNGVCRIKHVSVDLTVTYTLPELITTSAATRKTWNQWFAKLLIHERGHKTVALKVAEEIETTLYGLPVMATCQQLSDVANSTAYALLDQAQLRHDQYDKDTNHGETEGAFLADYL